MYRELGPTLGFHICKYKIQVLKWVSWKISILNQQHTIYFLKGKRGNAVMTFILDNKLNRMSKLYSWLANWSMGKIRRKIGILTSTNRYPTIFLQPMIFPIVPWRITLSFACSLKILPFPSEKLPTRACRWNGVLERLVF